MNRRHFLAAAGAGVALPSAFQLNAWAKAGASGQATFPLEVGEVVADIGGALIKTIGYNGKLPGTEIRLKQGEVLRAPVTNRLKDEATIVHWHGISSDNAMDGTKLTQDPIESGDQFTYEFLVPEAGTHWYHAHYRKQSDKGCYGALIVEPTVEELSYDREFVLILDDWNDGICDTDDDDADFAYDHGAHEAPAQSTAPAPAAPTRRMGGFGSFAGGADAWSQFDDEIAQTINFGGVVYPFMLINGKAATDPEVFDVRKGDRIRLRIINAAADTAFRFAVQGHPLTVTHSDGMPVEPVQVDTVRIGMAERYDVLIDATNPGLFQIAAMPEAKEGLARAVLRYVDAPASSAPPADFKPAELEQRLLSYDDLVCTFPAKVPVGAKPDRVFDMVLHHTRIDVAGHDPHEDLMVREGEVIRFNMINDTGNYHPMHMHGHHFHLGTKGRALKDTAIIAPRGGTMTWDWKADNPGLWMMHCHNLYHMKDGMMRHVTYT